MLPPRTARGAKPLMSRPPAAVAPTSSGGARPDPYPGQSDRVNYYARQMEARQMPEPRSWSGGSDPSFQDVGQRLGQMLDQGLPTGGDSGVPAWDGTMYGVRLPQSQPTMDEARNALNEMGRSGGVTAGPSVTGPNGGIPGLPGYDPNARGSAVGGNELAPQDPTMRVRNRIARAAGERPLMGRGYRP